MLTKNISDSSEIDLVLYALANKTRREIVAHLGLQPASILQIAHHVHMSLPAIHRHIKILEDAHLITRKKIGRVNVLTINRAGVVSVQQWLSEFHAYWGTDEESLGNYEKSLALKEERIKNNT